MILNLHAGVSRMTMETEKRVLEGIVERAEKEWINRYPNTICPSLHEKISKTGGFDFYYTGPRVTVDLEEEK